MSISGQKLNTVQIEQQNADCRDAIYRVLKDQLPTPITLKTDQYSESHEFASSAINQLTFTAQMCKVVESQLQFPTFDRI